MGRGIRCRGDFNFNLGTGLRRFIGRRVRGRQRRSIAAVNGAENPLYPLTGPAAQQQEGSGCNKESQENQKKGTEERTTLRSDRNAVVIKPVDIRIGVILVVFLFFKTSVAADTDTFRAHNPAVESSGVVIAVAVNCQQAAEAHGKPRWEGNILQIDQQHGDVPIPGIIQLIQTVGGGEIGLGNQGKEIIAVFNRPGDVLVPRCCRDDTLVIPDAKTGGLHPTYGFRSRIGIAVRITEKNIRFFTLVGSKRTVFKKHGKLPFQFKVKCSKFECGHRGTMYDTLIMKYTTASSLVSSEQGFFPKKALEHKMCREKAFKKNRNMLS